MAPRIDKGTLEQYLKDNNLTIIERQPASMVPPIYRGKPKEEQVLTGVHGVEEILFSDGSSKCICSNCTNVFDTAASANAHRSRCSKVKDVKAEEKQTRAKKTEEMTAALQKTRTKDKDGEKSYGDLKKELGVLRRAFEALKTDTRVWTSALEEQNTKWEEAYATLKQAHETLQGNYALLDRANESLREEVVRLRSYFDLPEASRIKFIEMMTNVITELGQRWNDAVTAQRNATFQIDDIINGKG